MLDPFEKWGRIAGWQKINGLWMPAAMAFRFTPGGCFCAVPCIACANGLSPPSIILHVSGLTSGECNEGNNCTSLNGDWQADFLYCYTYDASHGYAQYQSIYGDITAAATIGYVVDGASNRRWISCQMTGINTAKKVWTKAESTVSEPYNCHDIASWDIPVNWGCCGGGVCLATANY